MSKAKTSNPARRGTDRRAGFTLIEVLIVLAIMSLIVGLVGPRVLGYLGSSRTKSAQVQAESFKSALELFYLDNGRYPTTSEGLTALVKAPGSAPRWSGPYLRSGSVPKDPWGNEYRYRSPGERGPFDIKSLGADGREGGADDAIDIVAN